jgi:hypothetical protein
MKIAAMLFVFSCAMFAQGQTSEGSHSVGGMFSFSSTHSNNHSSTLLDISPEASIFLRDNLEVGTFLSTQFTFGGGTNAVWGIGPYINWYFTENPVKPLVGIQYSYNYFYYGRQGDSGNLFTLQGGLLVPLNPKVALQPILQLNLYTDSGSHSAFQVLIGISLKAFL